MGVSPGTFYNYYKNKRDILDHVVNAVVKEFMGLLTDENAPDAPTTLAEYEAQAMRIAVAVDAIVDSDPRGPVAAVQRPPAFSTELSERVLGLYDLMAQLAKTYLDNGSGAGSRAPTSTTGTRSADAVTGMFVGATIRALRSDLGPDARRDMFAAHVRLLLDGVRAR